jgi:arginyl-tRNA synthetase
MLSGSELISRHLAEALAEAASSIEGCGRVSPEQMEIEVPREKAHGDLSCNLALALAASAGRRPRELAEDLASRAEIDTRLIERIEVAGPGFINVFFALPWLQENVTQILRQGETYGTSSAGGGARVLVEYVSANPTGPLNVVSARAAAVGNSLVRLLRARGYETEAEFYVNDTGGQADLLGESLEARFRQTLGEEAAVPQGGYPGEYLTEMAGNLPKGLWKDVLKKEPGERTALFRAKAIERILEGQQADLEAFGVTFDRWFRESSLHGAKAVDNALLRLQDAGAVAERDGAQWLLSTQYGDDEDRVLVRSTGVPTYLLGDIAYHMDKHERGYDKVIDIWGPDHHGHIPRMNASLRALGYPPGWLEVLIVQWVTLIRGGETVGMSKRKGEYVTMKELVDDVGADCARYLFLTRRCNTPLDFDLDLAKTQSDENPVYYVQYSHARVASILRFAAEQGVDPGSVEEKGAGGLAEPEEVDLMKTLALYPRLVGSSVRSREPHRLTEYCRELAGGFHRFYHKHRVVSEKDGVSMPRLALVEAVQTVLRNALALLGVSAPDRM